MTDDMERMTGNKLTPSSVSRPLSTDQQRRYARHIVLPEIGKAGQAQLLHKTVAVIGAGGLGSAVLAYLAAAGIGRVRIIEPDRVELSNLQRQVLYETGDIGRGKADAAMDRIHEVNPDCRVDIVKERFSEENAASVLQYADIVADGSDNFDTRFAVAEACQHLRLPLVSAAISGFHGQLSTFKPHLGAPHPCYRCLVRDHPDYERSCAQEGIAGPLAGMLGSMQALEIIKELLGIGDSLSGHLLLVDGLRGEYRKITLVRDPACRVCAKS